MSMRLAASWIQPRAVRVLPRGARMEGDASFMGVSLEAGANCAAISFKEMIAYPDILRCRGSVAGMGTVREGGVAAKKRKENWTVRERETVLETPWFRIVRNTCEVPGGTIVPTYYVQYEKDAVMVLVVDAKGRVLLEEQ